MASSWKRNARASGMSLPQLRDAKVTPLDSKCSKCGSDETENAYMQFDSGWDIETIFGKIYYKVCSNKKCGAYQYLRVSSNLQEYWDKKDAQSDLDEAREFVKIYRDNWHTFLDMSSKSKSFLMSDSVSLIERLARYTESLEKALKDNNIPLPDTDKCKIIGKKLDLESPSE